MYKYLYWLIGIAIVALIVVGVAISIIGWDTIPTLTPTQHPTGGTNITPATQVTGPNTMSIALQSGEMITVKDFRNASDVKKNPNTEGSYYVGYFIDPGSPDAPNIPYAIEYLEKTNFFSIVLLQEPLETSRKSAEEYLMQKLGISESFMCRLRYTISVTTYVNRGRAGESFGFSFCPGASEL